jgi:hypothetical protein
MLNHRDQSIGESTVLLTTLYGKTMATQYAATKYGSAGHAKGRKHWSRALQALADVDVLGNEKKERDRIARAREDEIVNLAVKWEVAVKSRVIPISKNLSTVWEEVAALNMFGILYDKLRDLILTCKHMHIIDHDHRYHHHLISVALYIL